MVGPVEYMGKNINVAHEAMHITDDLFRVRRSLLDESLRGAGLEEDLRERWLMMDSAFMKKSSRARWNLL